MSNHGLCDGRVVIVTGAGRGIGRAHALAFAAAGAKVVVNDLGVALDGSITGDRPADEVVAEIHAGGGEAIANHDDVADDDGARRLIEAAISHFGRLDVLVNNAGIIRDRMLVNLDVDEFDAIVRVHMRGHFCTMHHAAKYWREQSKAGEPVDARIINTSSHAGLWGNVGQTHYSAAKLGIVAMTKVAAAELARYGVTANAIAPTARTRMTEHLPYQGEKPPEGTWDPHGAENIPPLVVWLGSPESAHVTGQIFMPQNGKIGMAIPPQRGPQYDKGARIEVEEVGAIVADLLAQMPETPKVIGT
jgi:NAD(P)-dependent dehydrogenase (short-subunit alcohol dehydrogenase family)